MSVYLDAVLTKHMTPTFNAIPEEVLKWLRERPDMRFKDFGVCIGATMQVVSVDQYLTMAEEREKAAVEMRRTLINSMIQKVKAGTMSSELATDQITKLFS